MFLTLGKKQTVLQKRMCCESFDRSAAPVRGFDFPIFNLAAHRQSLPAVLDGPGYSDRFLPYSRKQPVVVVCIKNL
jgi:hypothetical protein